MTARLLRRGLDALGAPAVLLAVVLAYGGGLWAVVLHRLRGEVERGEPGIVVHVLRDSTLGLPLALAAAVLAAGLVQRLSQGRRASPRLRRAALAASAALIGSVLLGAGNPVHGALFGASERHADPLGHAARDASMALPVQLALALVAMELAAWARRRRAPRDRRIRLRRLAPLAGGALAFAPVAVLVHSLTERVVAATTPAPCAPSAPVKRFDVRAIDVDIPLNRFGDHDPNGKMYVLANRVADVRAQEASRHVSRGLRDDAIQPLVIRANAGDCVEIKLTNEASGGEYGIHLDGFPYLVSSSGDAVGRNPSSSVARGETRTYRYWIPREREVEGLHYMRPGAGNGDAISHGLFGALAVEPAGSRYLSVETGQPIASGWQATIVPASGKAFREYSILFHEVGNESYDIIDRGGRPLPRVDPHTSSYRPASRAINYRSEPFMRRLDRAPGMEALAYSSYPFGDPPTPLPRAYQGDPTKIRILHGGSEVFHVYHLHGGGIRWRANPTADPTWDYGDTGLDKSPVEASPSTRLDSQSIGPGESYNLEIEGGAGGVQQGAGEFLFHCHIAEHYVSGMWSFWRVYDTRQPDLAPLPDRAAPPQAVDSAGLIGRTMPDGTAITRDNLDAWVRPQLPPQGIPRSTQDGQVWDWDIESPNSASPIYVGAPEDRSSWPNLSTSADADGLSGHPGLFPGDRPVGPQNRPKILFNPRNGRPAFPLLRPDIARRNPFAPNGHSGAPWLGESGGASAAAGGAPDPWAGRPDGICPRGAPVRRFDVVALELPIPVTTSQTEPAGRIFVLAQDADDVLAGRKRAEPLAIRANIGDCVAVTLASRLTDATDFAGFAKTNIHIHHVQFDTQASDGVVTGLSYEQTIRPYAVEDPTLAAASTAGDTTLRLTSAAKFSDGAWIAVSIGTGDIEIRQIATVNRIDDTITLSKPLTRGHPAGRAVGTEFVQYRWYPDVQLDNVFFHDHVDGIRSWGRGQVGQLIVEPKGSTYHDPATGAPVDSGTYVDVRTTQPLARGQVEGAFRELALWTIDENSQTDSTINLRAEPWAQRLAADPDPSLLFSSWRHGDPATPLPRAYRGDPFVIRTINVGPTIDTLRVDGHRMRVENRFVDPATGQPLGAPTDTLQYGVSERFTAILEGGAGGVSQRPGDYLYMNGLGRRFRQGAWGILRVLPRRIPGLNPLPGTSVPDGGSIPSPTGGRPPATPGTGEPCPGEAPQRTFAVSAVDVGGAGAADGARVAYVPSSRAAAVRAGTDPVTEPLVLHAAAGDCVNVRFANERGVPPAPAPPPRASFHVAELDRTADSSGYNVGYGSEQTILPGETRTYRYYADSSKVGAASISDFGDIGDSELRGLYGAIVVAPRGATFTDPVSGRPTDVGALVDVRDGPRSYRDFTLILADDDPVIGGNFMPYPTAVTGPSLVNYRTAPRPAGPAQFSSLANGDPKTPLLRAYAGDPLRIHALGSPNSEQGHVLGLGGLSWPRDPGIPHAEETSTGVVAPWGALEIEVVGGAGGRSRTTGDFFYGDLRRPFANAGMWGLLRVLSDPSCPIQPLPGRTCAGEASLVTDLPPAPFADPAPPAPRSDSTPAPPAGDVAPATAPAPAPAPGDRIEVLGVRTPQPCARDPLTVSVPGRELRAAVFLIDGVRLRVVRRPNRRGRLALTIDPRRFKRGWHRIGARLVPRSRRAKVRTRLTLRTFRSCRAERRDPPSGTGIKRPSRGSKGRGR